MIAPNFIWVLRDFALKLVNANGKSISSDEYMEEALKTKEGFSKEIQKRNKTYGEISLSLDEIQTITHTHVNQV